jgi:hypothetical protein
MLKMIYLLTNRGRANDTILPLLLEEIKQNDHFILILDESDATDKERGLDGRLIYELIQKNTSRNDITVYQSEDPDVDVGLIYSNSLNLKSNELKQINKWALKYPQGSSEHYKHFRLTTQFDFNNELSNELGIPGLNLVSQHNPAFIRPLLRAIQSSRAMKILTDLQKQQPDRVSFLARDQNTWIPGEGKFEKLLRLVYKLDCKTDNVKRRYKFEYLEHDTGGLNKLTNILYTSGILNFLSKFAITFADKIETITSVRGVSEELGLNIEPGYLDVDKLDHGMLFIEITKS